MTAFVQAAHYRVGRVQTPNVVVVHTIEAAQTSTTAQAVARYFASQPPNDPNPTSAHGIVDAGQLIRMVRDSDTAYAAGTHGNRIGLHLEHAGRAAYTAAQWDTPYTDAMLRLSAQQIAAWCKTYSIPAVKIGKDELLAGKPGICGHIDITNAWPADTTHWDPGPSWPWAKHLGYIQAELNPEGDDMPLTGDDAKTVWTAPVGNVKGQPSWWNALNAKLDQIQADLDAIKAKP